MPDELEESNLDFFTKDCPYVYSNHHTNAMAFCHESCAFFREAKYSGPTLIGAHCAGVAVKETGQEEQ